MTAHFDEQDLLGSCNCSYINFNTETWDDGQLLFTIYTAASFSKLHFLFERILRLASSSYARQGITAVRIPEANASIRLPDCAINSFNHKIAVNCINISENTVIITNTVYGIDNWVVAWHFETKLLTWETLEYIWNVILLKYVVHFQQNWSKIIATLWCGRLQLRFLCDVVDHRLHHSRAKIETVRHTSRNYNHTHQCVHRWSDNRTQAELAVCRVPRRRACGSTPNGCQAALAGNPDMSGSPEACLLTWWLQTVV